MPVTPNSLIMPQKLRKQFISILPADTTSTWKTAFTAGANGSKIIAMCASSSDPTARGIHTLLQRSSITISATPIPASAGFNDATSWVNLLLYAVGLPRDSDGQKFFYLEANDQVWVRALITVAAGAQMNVYTIGADY
jgi:hypothetical protein